MKRQDADVTAAQAGAQSPALPSTRVSQYSGVGLALIIFVVAVIAWRSAPFNPPRKLKIDPTELKLDRNLDLSRTGGAARSSPPGPARSR